MQKARAAFILFLECRRGGDSWEREITLRNMIGDPGRNHGLLKASPGLTVSGNYLQSWLGSFQMPTVV